MEIHDPSTQEQLAAMNYSLKPISTITNFNDSIFKDIAKIRYNHKLKTELSEFEVGLIRVRASHLYPKVDIDQFISTQSQVILKMANNCDPVLLNTDTENSIDWVYGTDISNFLSEAKSVYDRQLTSLIESNPIYDDYVPFFHTNHLCIDSCYSHAQRGEKKTFSNDVGIVKFSTDGIMRTVNMLAELQRLKCAYQWGHIAIMVPNFQNFRTLVKDEGFLKSINSKLEHIGTRVFFVINPYLKNNKHWYLLNGDNNISINVQKNIKFGINRHEKINSDGSITLSAKIAYSTSGFVHLGYCSNIIRATHG